MAENQPLSMPKRQHGPELSLDPASVKRILVCQLRQIGDVLLTTPSLELLARRYPEAEIHVFTEKKCLPVLDGNPHVHTVWPVDKKAMPSLFSELAYYRKVSATGFDLVINFQQLPRCRWVVGFSRAGIKLGAEPPWHSRWMYTHWVEPDDAYAAAFKAQLLAPLGIYWNGERPRMYLRDEEKAEARELLSSMGLAGVLPESAGGRLRLVTVDATHRHHTRQWLPENFAALMSAVSRQSPDIRFLLPFGPGERETVRNIQRACENPEAVIVPENMLSLRQMAGCMEHAIMHLGNCSAPRHIATAMGTPTFTILGSTSHGWTFPSAEHTHIRALDFMDMPCQPCNRNKCPHDLRCMRQLTPELVRPVFLEQLERFGNFQQT